MHRVSGSGDRTVRFHDRTCHDQQRRASVAYSIAGGCRFNDVNTIFIDPRSPEQNAWIECLNGKLRDELPNRWQFESLLEAKVLIEDHRIDLNTDRPYTDCDGLAPRSSPKIGRPTTNQKSHSKWTTYRVPVRWANPEAAGDSRATPAADPPEPTAREPHHPMLTYKLALQRLRTSPYSSEEGGHLFASHGATRVVGRS